MTVPAFDREPAGHVADSVTQVEGSTFAIRVRRCGELSTQTASSHLTIWMRDGRPAARSGSPCLGDHTIVGNCTVEVPVGVGLGSEARRCIVASHAVAATPCVAT